MRSGYSLSSESHSHVLLHQHMRSMDGVGHISCDHVQNTVLTHPRAAV